MKEQLRRGWGAREIESKGVLLRQRERQRRREGLIYKEGIRRKRHTKRDVEKRHGEETDRRNREGR